MMQKVPFSIELFCILLIVATNVVAIGYICKQLYVISKKKAIKEKIQKCVRRIANIFKKSGDKSMNDSSGLSLQTDLLDKSEDVVSNNHKELVIENLEKE